MVDCPAMESVMEDLLKKHPELKTLKLWLDLPLSLTSSAFTNFLKTSNLEVLDINVYETVSDSIFLHLLTNGICLRSLSISGSTLTGIGLENCPERPNLERLNLGNNLKSKYYNKECMIFFGGGAGVESAPNQRL